MDKVRISAMQMAILLYATIMATAVLIAPSVIGKFAKQDMWISPVWGAITGFLTVFIAYRLNKAYPEQTIIQYSEKIVGRIPGKLIGFLFLVYYLHLNAISLREYGEFVKGNFLIETPMVILLGTMAFVCVFAVRGGIEAMARSAQIFVPLVIVLFLFIAIMLIPDLKPKNMLPVMENGPGPSIMGGFISSSWFMQFFLIAFLLPSLGKGEKGLKWGSLSVIAVMVTLAISNLFSLLLLGDITSTFVYPVMSAVRFISIAEFLQHLESIVMAIWVAGTFVKIAVFHYVLVIGTAQWLNLSDYKQLVYPLGFLLVIVAIWSAPNLQKVAHVLATTWPFYDILVHVLIPVLLLFVAMIRKKATKGSN
ncbi:endospore germination permease [Lentibacillus halophilus]